MKGTGTGSRRSPISIDDSEDEVLQVLVGETSFDSNPSPLPNRLSTTDQRNKLPRSRTLSTDQSISRFQYSTAEGKVSQKRKRSANDQQGGSFVGPGQPRPTMNHSSHARKKAKKRRRKMERQAMGVDTLPLKQQSWSSGTSYLLPEIAPSPMPETWPTAGMAYTKPSPVQAEHPSPFLYSHPNYPQHSQFPAAAPTASSSAWVASMAMAADSSSSSGPDAWESYHFIPKWSGLLQPPPASGTHSHNPTAERQPPQQPAEPLPLPPPDPGPAPTPAPIPTIGMKPDQDPSSKHGLYEGSLKNGGTSYIPNPARTLVVEQLPKTNRNTDFINSWSKTACGAYPVYVSIDSQAAKALVEFATAELARKAWSSPRLGTSLVGLKTHKLKGRPREDLIKVWWYRVDGIGANAGVGEIEEGEIEGDAMEKEVEVPVKKETKKERKARLAKERQAKQKVPTTTSAPPQTLSQAVVTIPVSDAVPSTAPMPTYPLPPNPANYSYYEHGHTYPYYHPSVLPTLSHPLPPHRPPPLPLNPLPPSRAPLLPQSALEAQWRPKHELPRKPARSTHGLTALPTQGGSIVLPRSPSPVQSIGYANHIARMLLKPGNCPVGDDMDVDDDMELESPQTGKRTSFGISLLSTPKNPPVSTPIPVTLAPSSSAMLGVRQGSLPPLFDSMDTVSNIPDGTKSGSYPTDQVLPLAPNIKSSSSSATPPLEPRAMKNAPKGPSYAKRSLMARHKELEERIARSKMELGIMSTPPTPLTDSIPTLAPPAYNSDDLDKQAMEERLRALVLRSQRSKAKTTITTMSLASASNSSASPVPSSSTTTNSPIIPAVSANPSLTPSGFSLDDLAVSFITETIQTFKASPASTIPLGEPSLKSGPPPPSGVATSQTSIAATKLELAAKQKRLEAQIAESKILMAKLASARTKQEREDVLVVMRERSRMPDENSVTTTTPTSAPTQPHSKPNTQLVSNAGAAPPSQTQIAFKKWPVSHEHAGVFIVSDDEEDDSDGDDGE